MYECKVADDHFMHNARARGHAERRVHVAAEQLWAALEDGPSWAGWVPVIKAVHWTSTRPYGEGTTRTVQLRGGVRLDEEFWTWREGRKLGFRVAQTNNPLLGALAETYEIDPEGPRRCSISWRMALELKGPLRAAEKYMRPSLGSAMYKMLGTLEGIARAF